MTEWFLLGGGEMGERMRAFDWSRSPLGLPEAWPRSLKTAVRIMLTSRQPFWIGWGEKLIFLYNDAYRSIIGGKHPERFALPTDEVWSEIWADIGPMLASAMTGAEGTYVEEQLLIMERNGYPEETYYTFSYSPIPDDDGGTGGIICANTEDTNRVIGERQLALLGTLGVGTRSARSAMEACRLGAAALDQNPFDLPFALVYVPDGDSALALAGRVGLPEDHPAAPETLRCDGSPWPVDDLRTGEARLVGGIAEIFGSTFPPSGLGAPPNQAAVLPLAGAGEAGRPGALVVGLNPFRLFDEGYRGFLLLVAGQIAAAIGSARAYEEERRRAEALSEIDRAKTAFFSNVSHEFRTPMTLMLGPLEEALADPGLDPGMRDDLGMVHRNGLRLLKLVNALLDFARVEAGRVQAVYQPTDLAALTADLASSFRSACERAGLELEVDCAPLPAPVHVDRDMWEKIVLNLVSNAFKFTLAGRIAVHLRSGHGHAVLTVSDTGVGIPAEALPRVFERFHRVENAQARTHEGSGIGLALVQELVKLHGGAISVESQPDAGTTFTVRIPLGTAHLPAERISGATAPAPRGTTAAAGAATFVEEALRWLPDGAAEGSYQLIDPDPPLPGGTAAAPDRPRGRILLADDNADMRDYLHRLLARDHVVEAVRDGEAALEAARATSPDLIVTDVMMPRIDGLSLLKELRAGPATREIPVILLSARAGEEAKVEGLRAGADDYLTKPFAARELLARVEAQLNMLRIRRAADLALRESEARFRNMADNAPVMVWITEPDGTCTFLSRSWYEHTGQTPETGLGFGWLDATHPDDRDYAHRTFLAASEGHEPFRLEYRLRRQDGTYGWAIDAARPRFGEDDAFLGYIGSVIDIDERRRAEEHRKLLVDELNHRVKNTLSIVQGIAHQTFRGDACAPARAAFEGRLGALATAHNMLTRANWEMATLEEVVRETTRLACAARDDCVDVSGPAVVLYPKQAVSLAMALHELSINALKYGALSQPSGRVAIDWSVDAAGPDRRLHFTWREEGGPRLQPPARRGFGTRMIQQALALELAGEVSMNFRPEGLVCTIEASLAGTAA